MSEQGEVLIGTDAEVDAVRQRPPFQLRDDFLVRPLVRDEVIGPEEAVGFRGFGDERPEFAVAKLRRQRVGNDLGANTQERRAGQAHAQARDDQRLATVWGEGHRPDMLRDS